MRNEKATTMKKEMVFMMKEKTSPPVYSQIALDIALRISREELKENTKIYGRSVMSSEYGVSPETIRRALKLLEDMGIVEVRKNSGVVILSVEKAKEFAQRFSEQSDIRLIERNLRKLLDQQHSLNEQIIEMASHLVRTSDKFAKSNPFQNYEMDVPPESPVIGKSLMELKFWQETAATIIAIRRQDKVILSPGPYAVLLEGDTLIFVGNISTIETVSKYISKIEQSPE